MSSRLENVTSMSQNHPRTCGENVNFVKLTKEQQGSPPHMRGKFSHLHFPKVIRRVTPAHAGKMHEIKGMTIYVKGHPRTCGENTT